ncbi:pilus assembly protein PilX [Parashewanella spongiae]|uniref:Pilus assembly protein PilX n=2 Tax=Parashewanella spongiae TaxID=342950 RepID=A0A3A6TFP3_9GAMM|nr:pilus assembly PilX N-terminal domain-containing protein [Parashewanella spongiae]MCL1079323.1 pilus assembly PilX N-terminal domain-containing protein [Parashewanella spongiae]RJY10413.1 pilus assembly protein PilX [Parashewanella spongiae]
MKKQQGVVLFFALIVLVLMTIIGVSLAVNSTQSIKMAGSGAERLEAISHIYGSQERFITQNQGNAMMTDLTAPAQVNDAQMGVSHAVMPIGCNPDADSNCTSPVLDTGCARKSRGSLGIKCRKIEVTTSARYGRNNLGQLVISSGMEQQVLDIR